MRFICLGYADQSKFDEMDREELEPLMESCFAYDDELRRGGHFLGGEALQNAANGVTLRFRDRKVDVTDGPFAETKEQLAGFYLVDARDLNEAIRLAAKIPPVRVGSIEVRPVRELQVV